MTAFITRIENDVLRIFLWNFWFPVAIAKYLLLALLSGQILRGPVWMMIPVIYILGIAGPEK